MVGCSNPEKSNPSSGVCNWGEILPVNGMALMGEWRSEFAIVQNVGWLILHIPMWFSEKNFCVSGRFGRFNSELDLPEMK